MRVSLLCTDPIHPVNGHLESWIQRNSAACEISLVRSKNALPGGDVLFIISCSEIVHMAERALYRTCLVLHASALPRGRGWSPHIWELLLGATELTLTLLEAEDMVDSGRIWRQIAIRVPKHALWNEINERLFDAELELMDFAIRELETVVPWPQRADVKPTYYRKRAPEDSRVDSERSIASQFDLIRVCDPQRFAAFFEMHGHKYKIKLEKMDE